MSIVKKYLVKVESVVNPIKDIYTVTFSSDKKFVYNPGQYLHLALDEYDGIGEWPESRCFSMQSSPSEELIKITFTVKGAFTQRMAENLLPGKQVWIKLPYGNLFAHLQNTINTVFIAGGTGITPFMSLFNSSKFNEYKNPRLYAGFRTKYFNVYEKELQDICKYVNNTLEIIWVYEDINGVLDITKILSENGREAAYYISGPQIMIKSFKSSLLENIVSRDNIITDEWE